MRSIIIKDQNVFLLHCRWCVRIRLCFDWAQSTTKVDFGAEKKRQSTPQLFCPQVTKPLFFWCFFGQQLFAKIFHKKISITCTSQNTPTSLQKSLFLGWHLETVNIKTFSQNNSLFHLNISVHSIEVWLMVITVSHVTQTGASSFFQKKRMPQMKVTTM